MCVVHSVLQVLCCRMCCWQWPVILQTHAPMLLFADLKTGVLSGAVGSAYVEVANTKVVCAMYVLFP
jgi:hypothetical protein